MSPETEIPHMIAFLYLKPGALAGHRVEDLAEVSYLHIELHGYLDLM